MNLAPEFAVWTEQLRRFPDDLAIALCPLLRQLAAALGSGLRSEQGRGEPDGVSGITQRERFERLLPTQWLLASEVPDEFLRRAAMQELMFLESARRKPRAAQRYIAVCDAGPSQLGAPRLIQLAMLLVLERRARSAKAQLEWLVAQRPQDLHDTCEQSDLLALLDARSPREPNLDDLRVVEAWIGSEDACAEVVWIGGDRLCELARPEGGQRCRLKDPLGSENDQILLEVQSGHRRREFALTLPAPEVRTRLIRRPFDTPHSIARSISVTADFCCFSPGGRRVLVFDGHRVEAHLPCYTRNHRPNIFAPEADAHIIAASWHNKSLLVLYSQGGSLRLDWAGTTLRVVTRQMQFAQPQADPARTHLVAMGRVMPRIFVRDSEGVLFAGRRDTGNSIELRPVLDRVLDLRWRHGYLAYARLKAPNDVEFGNIDVDGSVCYSKTCFCATPLTVIAGSNRSGVDPVFAVQIREREQPMPEASLTLGGRWHVVGRSALTQDIDLRDTELAIACLPRTDCVEVPTSAGAPSSGTWVILAYSVLEQRLYAVGDDLRHPLCKIPEPASRIQWDERTARLLYRDHAGRIQVVNYRARKPAYPVGAGEAAVS
jgi:hypothetical protein